MLANSHRTLIICAVSLLSACAGGGGATIAGGGGVQPQLQGGASNPLSYVTWGPWSAGGSVGTAPSGTMTASSAMPKSGTADYSGSAYATNGATGSTHIGVNFGTAAVNMDLTIGNVTANGTGSVSGNGYNVKGKQSASLDVPIVLTGYDFAASGAFYGPSASERRGPSRSRLKAHCPAPNSSHSMGRSALRNS
jgi:hypothetical protein